MKDRYALNGKVKIDINGEVVLEKNNRVVDTGKNYILRRLVDTDIPSQISHMAVGTNPTAPEAADLDLLSIAGPRVEIISTTVTDNEIEYIASFSGALHTGELREAGLFNAITGETMMSRLTFNTITLATQDTMTITWTISLRDIAEVF